MTGGKAGNLAVLQARGVPVPRGFVLPEGHYRAHFERLNSAVALALGDEDRVRNIFCDEPLMASSLEALRLGLSRFDLGTVFAVRSSGRLALNGGVVAEDGTGISLAGQFDSLLNVPAADVPTAVKACWASLFADRTVELYGDDPDYLRGSGMDVVIQEMVPAVASAVMMTVDPTGDGTSGAIESTWGACEAIVSGTVTPDYVAFDRSSKTIVDRMLGAKAFIACHQRTDGRRDRVQYLPTPDSMRGRFALDDNQLTSLIRLGVQIEAIFGRPQDIEAVFTDDSIVITQARAVTALPSTWKEVRCTP